MRRREEEEGRDVILYYSSREGSPLFTRCCPHPPSKHCGYYIERVSLYNIRSS